MNLQLFHLKERSNFFPRLQRGKKSLYFHKAIVNRLYLPIENRQNAENRIGKNGRYRRGTSILAVCG